MTIPRPNNEVAQQLIAQCEQYNNEPQTGLDKLWVQLANDPDRALDTFARHADAFNTREQGNTTRRLQVAAAMGGLLVASEAGVNNASVAWSKIQKEVNSRTGVGSRGTLGGAVLQMVANPARYAIDGEDATKKSPHGMLPTYLAANALDDPAYTVWKRPVHVGTVDTVRSAAAGVKKAAAFVQKMRGRAQNSTPAAPGQKPEDQYLSHDMQHMNRLASGYLVETMKHKRRGDYGRSADSVVLATGYGSVALEMGAVAKFYRDPNDVFSRQLIEDFLSSCFRVSGVSDPQRTAQAVGSRVGKDLAEMFTSAELLFYKRGVPIKGPGLARNLTNHIRNSLSSTTIEGPSGRTLAEDHRKIKDSLTLKDADGNPLESGQPKVTTETLRERAKEAMDARRQAGKRSGHPPQQSQQSPAAQPAGAETAPGRPKSYRINTRGLADLLEDPLDAELVTMPRGEEFDPMYPWSKVLATLSIRFHGGAENLSGVEKAIYMKQRAILHKLVWNQLVRTGALREISRTGKVRDDVFAGAVDVHRWLTGQAASPGISRQEQAKFAVAETQFRQALTQDIRRRYGIPPDKPISQPLFSTLAELTSFDLSGIRDNPGGRMTGERSFWRRVTNAMVGWPLTAPERAYYDRVNAVTSTNRSIRATDLPPRARDIFTYLQRRAVGYTA